MPLWDHGWPTRRSTPSSPSSDFPSRRRAGTITSERSVPFDDSGVYDEQERICPHIPAPLPNFLEADIPVVPKKLLQVLVFVLPLSLVSFAVLMGGSALARALGDPGGARVLGWIAAAVLMLGLTDMILLITALGLQALARPAADSSGDPD